MRYLGLSMKDLDRDDEIVPKESGPVDRGIGDSEESVLYEEYQGEQIKKLKDKLKEAEAKAKEYLDGWQRAQAEFVNVRKRDEEAKLEFLKFSNAQLLTQFLPVLDSLELSLPHGNKELEVIYKQLLSVLKSNGLEEENPLGASFDPRCHEAVGEVEVKEESESEKVVEVVQKGYILSGRIIRPSKVRIGKFIS
jgi:molecular chaperone GrpE